MNDLTQPTGTDERTPLQRLVDNYIDKLHSIEQQQQQADDMKAHIIAEMENASEDKVEVADGIGVRLQSPARRFDMKLAESFLTVEQRAACIVPKFDAATAKKVLPPAIYDVCCQASKNASPSLRVFQ